MKCRKGWISFCVAAFAFILIFGTAPQADAKAKQKSLAKAKITLSKTSYTYNGKAQKPKVTVKLGKKKLKKKDYTVKYSKNKNAGTAKVTVKAKKGKKAKYKGSKSKTFKIKKAARKVIPARTVYSAVEGDGAFTITAKASAGTGKLTYSCSTANVIKITKAGKVTIVKKFDKTCKTLSSQTKETIKKVSAKVKISVPASTNYKAASTTVTVTINKKPVRVFNTYDSIKNYKYPEASRLCPGFTNYKKLTDFQWTVVDKYQMPGLAPTADDDWTKDYIQCNNLCPQGVCMAGDYMLTTAYCMDDIHNSCIFVYNNKTGEFLKTLVLKDQKSHVGGITYDEKAKNIWICHSKKDKATGMYSLEKITYSDLVKYAAGKKEYTTSKSVELHKIPTKPSTISYNKKDGYVWVAQFSKGDSDGEDTDEEVEDNDTGAARMYAYEYDAEKNVLKQVRVIQNPAEEDYLGIKTTESTQEGEEGAEPVTMVQVDSVYSSSTVQLTVKDDTNAKKEKLKKGDILYKINEVVITSRDQLKEELEKYEAGDTIRLEVHRTVPGMPSETVTGTAATIEGQDQQPADGSQESQKQVLEGTIKLSERGNVLFRTIPSFVQGITFSGDRTIFSCSYGRNSTKKTFISELHVYNNADLEDPSMLGDLELAIALPPMVEEVEVIGDEVYMIFESAATTYLEGTDGKGQSTCPIDKIVAAKLNFAD